MNQQRSKERIREEIELQLKERGYATAVDTLIRIGWLTPANFEAWKKERIPYPEFEKIYAAHIVCIEKKGS